MDLAGRLSLEAKTSLVFLAFLRQSPTANVELQKELDSLAATWDVNGNLPRAKPQGGEWSHPARTEPEGGEDDGGSLQTDGQMQSNFLDLLGDLQPQVVEENVQDAAAIAGDLRAIADQLEESVVMRATERLSNRLSRSPVNRWQQYLALEVESLSRQLRTSGLAREQLLAALVLTLVRGVCERAPNLLRSLYRTALTYLTR